MSFRQGHGSGEKARCFCSAICRRWPIARFSPVSSLPLLVRADISQPIRLSSGQTRLGRPRRRGGSRSISRPSDRSTEPASGLGPFGSGSLRQKHRRANGTPASITQTIRTGATYRLHAAPWQPHQLIGGRHTEQTAGFGQSFCARWLERLPCSLARIDPHIKVDVARGLPKPLRPASGQAASQSDPTENPRTLPMVRYSRPAAWPRSDPSPEST
jgi:hypothetical protein